MSKSTKSYSRRLSENDMTIKTSALDGNPVAGFRVRVWLYSDEDGWWHECPCLKKNGRNFKTGAWESREVALRAGLSELLGYVTELKNANTPVPWIEGQPEPRDRNVEVRRLVVS